MANSAVGVGARVGRTVRLGSAVGETGTWVGVLIFLGTHPDASSAKPAPYIPPTFSAALLDIVKLLLLSIFIQVLIKMYYRSDLFRFQ